MCKQNSNFEKKCHTEDQRAGQNSAQKAYYFDEINDYLWWLFWWSLITIYKLQWVSGI